MPTKNFTAGWVRKEAPEIQELINEHRLSHQMTIELRKFAANPAGVEDKRLVGASLARGLVQRKLGDVDNHAGHLPGRLSKYHPQLYFSLNEDGINLAVRLGTRDASPEAGL